jgi:hypothetical protein
MVAKGEVEGCGVRGAEGALPHREDEGRVRPALVYWSAGWRLNG